MLLSDLQTMEWSGLLSPFLSMARDELQRCRKTLILINKAVNVSTGIVRCTLKMYTIQGARDVGAVFDKLKKKRN